MEPAGDTTRLDVWSLLWKQCQSYEAASLCLVTGVRKDKVLHPGEGSGKKQAGLRVLRL